MKRNIIIVLFAIFLLLVSDGKFKVEPSASNAGDWIMESAKFVGQNKHLFDDKAVIATIEGKPIYRGEFEFVKKNYELSGNLSGKDADRTAFEQLALNKYEEYLTEELGISVTQEEIQKTLIDERDLIYKDEESLNFFEDYILALNMTEEEYWSRYRPLQLKKYLTHVKLQNYLYNEAIEKGYLPKENNKEAKKQHDEYMKKQYEKIKANIEYEFKDDFYKDKLSKN